jgi:hypothetical protein
VKSHKKSVEGREDDGYSRHYAAAAALTKL